MGAVRDPEATAHGLRSSTFGKYQLFASLGRGGMAEVYLSVARGQMGLTKLAVIKRLRRSLAEEVGFRTMFLDEARLAARLSHPNIVHTYEVGEQEGIYFIAMEYLDGQSLNKVLKESLDRKTRIAPPIAARVVADALAGLGYAHELRDYDGQPLRIIHRDVSPHNVFVTYDGHTKIVDFGIAKATLSSTETEVGVLKGKVAYMAPEQALGRPIDARADLFAAGIVLWELVAQRRLMTGESAANTLHKLMNEPIPRLSEVLDDIDPALDAIVARALSKEPDERYPSAGEMRRALEAWLSSLAEPPGQDDVGRFLLSLFRDVREDLRHRIREHVAAVPALADPPTRQISSTDPVERWNVSDLRPSGQLAHLGSSGSGVIVNPGPRSARWSFPPLEAPGAGPSSAPNPLARVDEGARAEPAEAELDGSRRSLWLLFAAVGCFALATLLFIVPAYRQRAGGELPGPIAERAPPLGSAPMPPARATASEEPSTAAETAETAETVGATAAALASTDVREKPSDGVRLPSARGQTAPRTSSPAPPRAEEPGFVTISSYPWAKVTEGPRSVCPVTPCNKVALAPGTHALTFENGETPGDKQTVGVDIRSGETTTKNVGFK